MVARTGRNGVKNVGNGIGCEMGSITKFGNAFRPCMLGLLVLLAGCQTSTYENRSTKDENVVTATGKAAEVAAGANTSHNCPSCEEDNATSSSAPRSKPSPSKTDESLERITDSAIDTLTTEVSQEINKTIRNVFE